KKYLDALAGIAVNTLGHGHPKLTRAIAEQSSRLIHTSNLYRIAEQESLADKLAAISGTDGVFFCNSGCEANEAAIKLARLYDRQGWLRMADAVQCGLGRVGKWFVYRHAGIQPDVARLAKGLASGVPIGACLARGAAAKVFKPGSHGSTCGGNPLACAAALA